MKKRVIRIARWISQNSSTETIPCNPVLGDADPEAANTTKSKDDAAANIEVINNSKVLRVTHEGKIYALATSLDYAMMKGGDSPGKALVILAKFISVLMWYTEDGLVGLHGFIFPYVSQGEDSICSDRAIDFNLVRLGDRRKHELKGIKEDGLYTIPRDHRIYRDAVKITRNRLGMMTILYLTFMLVGIYAPRRIKLAFTRPINSDADKIGNVLSFICSADMSGEKFEYPTYRALKESFERYFHLARYSDYLKEVPISVDHWSKGLISEVFFSKCLKRVTYAIKSASGDRNFVDKLLNDGEIGIDEGFNIMRRLVEVLSSVGFMKRLGIYGTDVSTVMIVIFLTASGILSLLSCHYVYELTRGGSGNIKITVHPSPKT